MANIENLSIDKINIDGSTQPRAKISQLVVADYAEEMKEDTTFPPVTVFYDGTSYWLADGFHRYYAAKKIDAKEIEAEVHDGDQREATLYAVKANHKHGHRRSNPDKKKAVLILLNDPEWSQWSDSEVARQCRVHHSTVAKYRSEVTCELASEPTRKTTTKHGTVATMNTANIGRRQKTEQRHSIEPVEAIGEGLPQPQGTTLTLPPDAAGIADTLLNEFPHDLLLDVVRELEGLLVPECDNSVVEPVN